MAFSLSTSSSDWAKLAITSFPGYIYTSADGGISWVPRESQRNWRPIASSFDGQKLVAAEYGGRIYTTTDGGITWHPRESSRNWHSIASSSDGTKLVACVMGGQIYTSSDSGVSWIARDANRYWCWVASSSDGTKLAACVQYGRIYTSSDSGLTWTARDSSRYWHSIACSSDGLSLIACEHNGQIYTSINGGVSWTPRDTNRSWTAVASSADGSKLAACVESGQIYTSWDSGATWVPRENSRDWRCITSSSDGAFLLANTDSSSYVYLSSDSGLTWSVQSVIPTSSSSSSLSSNSSSSCSACSVSSAPSTINADRYFFVAVKSGVSDFKKIYASKSYYLLRRPDGSMFVKCPDTSFEEEVNFTYDPSVLDRSFTGRNMGLSVKSESPENIEVFSVGKNPYRAGQNSFDCVYYSDFESGSWHSLGIDSRISDPLPSYAVIVYTDNSKSFFVFQDGTSTSIYEILSGSISKKCYIDNFYLYDAIKYGNDIAICGTKTGIDIASGPVYEDATGTYITYYENSPTVFVCTYNSDYEQMRSFCQESSVFPTMCKKDRESISIYCNSNFIHILALSYNPSSNSFIPVHAFGQDEGAWRYLNNAKPFGTIDRVVKTSLVVDQNNVPYASCKIGDEIYLTFYSYEENRWVSYDKSMMLLFDSSSSSSSSSSRSSRSSSSRSSSRSSSSRSCSCSSSSRSSSFSSSSSRSYSSRSSSSSCSSSSSFCSASSSSCSISI